MTDNKIGCVYSISDLKLLIIKEIINDDTYTTSDLIEIVNKLNK